jgi:hypothetical protein
MRTAADGFGEFRLVHNSTERHKVITGEMGREREEITPPGLSAVLKCALECAMCDFDAAMLPTDLKISAGELPPLRVSPGIPQKLSRWQDEDHNEYRLRPHRTHCRPEGALEEAE